MQCRICLEEDYNIEDLITPCNCRGTQQYVHRACLEEWLSYNIGNDNYKRCQECLKEYNYEDIEVPKNKSTKYFIKFYKLLRKFYIFNIFLSYFFNFVFGIIVSGFAFVVNNDLSTEIIKLSTSYPYFTIPTVGNVLFVNSYLYYQ